MNFLFDYSRICRPTGDYPQTGFGEISSKPTSGPGITSARSGVETWRRYDNGSATNDRERGFAVTVSRPTVPLGLQLEMSSPFGAEAERYVKQEATMTKQQVVVGKVSRRGLDNDGDFTENKEMEEALYESPFRLTGTPTMHRKGR